MLLRKTSLACQVAAALLIGGNNYAAAQSSANVLVVQNDASPASKTVAEYYMQKRAVPAENLCHISVKPEETIARQEFDVRIQTVLAQCIASTSSHDRILYIVLTKGVPLRIAGTDGRQGTVASVDSELTLLYRRMTGVRIALPGPVQNPYFAGSDSATPKPLAHEDQDIYLVTRLDGYTVEDAIGLIDRGSAPSKSGRILLDGRSSWQDKGNVWLKATADKLTSHGLVADRVEYDDTAKVLSHETEVLGYYSWGSNDPAIRIRHFDLKFEPGAIGAMFVSSDARTMNEPPPTWTLGDWDKRDTYYAGSPQSLTGDLIRDGITGAAGHVAEPYLDATIRPDLLFPAYLSGANLAEAFYQAMPYLSWQTVVFGDPLCAPFRTTNLTAESIDKGLDPQTELPGYFSARRLKAASQSQIKREALVAILKAEARAARKDLVGVREALEAAVAITPQLTTAHMTLAVGYQRDGMLDQAIAHYRAVLSYAPDDAVVLNNLAFLLAVDRHAPEEAHPLALHAVSAGRNNPVMVDTLAWIEHLLGRDAEAVRLLGPAVTAAPNIAEIRWHAAIAFAGVDNLTRAASELDAAVKLDPKLADREETKKLRQRLGGKGSTPPTTPATSRK